MTPTRALLAASLALASPALGQPAPSSPLPVSRAVPATSPIRLDGKLDEAAWAAAPATTEFTQINPDEGRPASERTEVRILFDADALYIGVRAFDRGPVTARLGRRDMPLGDSDWFGVMIDSYHDHRTAFGFDVNPAGVQRDEIKTINSDNNSWDAVWQVSTSIDTEGWVAEYRIPFSQLRFKPGSEQTWGIQLERIIGRRNEYMVSTFIPKRETGGVPAYGHLEGITDLQPGGRLELLPYTLARAEFIERGNNPFRDRHEYANAVGLDLRYRVASNLTLTGTINPDFGQVEVDPAVVNLGVYETFFDEKRPFFLEGGEIFDFGLGNTSGGRLFYSRRIGRPPSLGAPTSRYDAPFTTTILGAAKLTGKVAGWSTGSLAALTGREEARYLDASNAEKFSPVEPRSGYFVSRARRELRNGQSLVGGMVSLVHRDLADSILTANFRSDAATAGVDFLHQWRNRTWSLRGDAELSAVKGSAASLIAVQRAGHHYFQRPDAAHLGVDSNATSLVGYSTSANLVKQAGLHWRGELAGALTSPEYEVNDLGFAQRTDRRDAQMLVTYQETKPGKTLRSWSTNVQIRSEHNYSNEPILTVARLIGTANTLGYVTFHGNLSQQFRSFDDRLTRGGPMAIRPAQTSAFLFLSSDGRKPVTLDGQFNWMQGEVDGLWSASAQVGVGIKTSSRWNLKVGPRFARAGTPAQFVTRVTDASYTPTYGVRYVFAPIGQTELGLETRFNYTFTPHLSLESYVQPLISSGDYGDAKQLESARTYDFVPYSGAIPNLDFNLRSLRGNAVLRWEWRPGSTMFVAWQQSRRNIGALGDFEFNRDQEALFAARPDNIFLVKLNWWLAR
jgi:hypothetical protein